MFKVCFLLLGLSGSIIPSDLWDINTENVKFENVQINQISYDSLYGVSTFYSSNYEFVTKATKSVTIPIQEIQWIGEINSTKRLGGRILGLFTGILVGYYLGDLYVISTTPAPDNYYHQFYLNEKVRGKQYKDYAIKVLLSVTIFSTIGYKTGKYFSKYSQRIELSGMNTEEKRNMLNRLKKV